MLEYNEAEVLSDYIWNNYYQFVTRFEGLAVKVVFGGEHKTESFLELARDNAPEVIEAVANNDPKIKMVITARIFREHLGLIHINRCPACDRIVRTPKARQCLWCSADWHSKF